MKKDFIWPVRVQEGAKRMSRTIRMHIILFFEIICSPCLIESRSPHRPEDPLVPTIITCWHNDNQKYVLKDSHIQEGPYFNLYDKQHIESHLLPSGPIPYRNHPETSVLGSTLSKLVENLIEEVHQGKKTLTHFTVLKQRDFDWKTNTGLIIAKFKDYPFVVKLSIETPKSFTQPEKKGFEPTCFFLMAGGVNRHLTGFTRVKNLEYLQKRIQESNLWKNRVSFPRKWFWFPQNNRLLQITTKNVGLAKEKKINISSMYAVIGEYIEIERSFQLFNKNDRRIAMSLSNYLQQNVDPHINNYVIEAHTRKIVPLDTEHFLILVGYNDAPSCKSYFHWYVHLGTKFFNDAMMRTKHYRREAQYERYWTSGQTIAV